MKYRKYFVTNSSSSCFIASYRGEETCIEEIKKKIADNGWDSYPVGEAGNLEFGWDQEVYDDFDSRLNFVVLQIIQKKDDIAYIEERLKTYHQEDLEERKRKVKEAEDNLLEIFQQTFGIPLDYSIVEESNEQGNAYIDHQSSGFHYFIFESQGDLSTFLFGKKSAVVMGNDNTYDYEGHFAGKEMPYRYTDEFVTSY